MTAAARLTGLAELATQSLSLAPAITKAAALISKSLRAGGTVYACGNGGSFADAAHFIAELTGSLNNKHREGLRAVQLGANGAEVTAIANDFGFELVFARPLAAHAKPGDVLVAFSTSGKSKNVRRAITVASSRGMHTIGIVGKRAEWELVPPSVVIQIDSDETQRIQELTAVINHALAEMVEASCAETIP